MEVIKKMNRKTKEKINLIFNQNQLVIMNIINWIIKNIVYICKIINKIGDSKKTQQLQKSD